MCRMVPGALSKRIQTTARDLEAFGMPDSFFDALIECVKACGGSKAVGVALWPSKGVEAAQRQLLACLNPERGEKLSLDELLHIMRLAREKGCHAGVNYICSTLSYSQPQPIEPRDESAELQRQYIEAARAMGKLAERIERLQGPVLTRAA